LGKGHPIKGHPTRLTSINPLSLFPADIGGTAGLFLGGSFITILELLYYIGRNFDFPIKNAANVKTINVRSNSVGDMYKTKNIGQERMEKHSDVFSVSLSNSVI
jgi:hypothetical protein